MKANERKVTEYDLSNFTVNEGTKMLSTFASDIRFRPGEALYTDACDEGIAVRSHHTRMVVRFFLRTVDHNSDGDVMAWHFEPVWRGDTPYNLVIFNT